MDQSFHWWPWHDNTSVGGIIKMEEELNIVKEKLDYLLYHNAKGNSIINATWKGMHGRAYLHHILSMPMIHFVMILSLPVTS